MIFTFYSYKGGVGRSMAAANVGHWLYQRGLDVVLVDWDLEAPGLESFFTDSPEELARIQSQVGIIDLLYTYVRRFPYLPKDDPFQALPPLADSLYPLKVRPTTTSVKPGSLRILSAGWRSGVRLQAYAESVQSFNWSEFYSEYRGEAYFNWFRDQLRSMSEVVLLDSRTGVTEMGGVCTRQLADVVAVLCAPNRQNVQGCVDMVQSFRDDDLKKARGRDLPFIILPARVDDQDSAGYKRFRDELFVPTIGPLLPDVFKEWKRTSWDLEIPYKTEYSYREGLVAGVPRANEKLDTAYRNLAAHLALFTPESHPLWTACEAELRVMAAKANKEFGARPWVAAETAFAGLPAEVQGAAQAILLRLIDYSPQSEELDSLRRATMDDFETPEASDVVAQLVRLGIVARLSDTPSSTTTPSLELAHPSFVRSWQRLRDWVKKEREFLLQRQEITERAEKWRDAGGGLLLDSQLALARSLRDGQASRLNALERRFIEASDAAEVAERRRVEQTVQQLEEERKLAEEKNRVAQAEVGRVEAEKRRLEEEAARRVAAASRTRRLAAGAVLSAVVLAVLAVSAFNWWVRGDAYQVRFAITDGVALQTSNSDVMQLWRQVLAASGHVEEVMMLAARAEPLQRPILEAQTAVWFARTGQSQAARAAADQALAHLGNPSGDGLVAYLQTLAVLQGEKLVSPERLAELLRAVQTPASVLTYPGLVATGGALERAMASARAQTDPLARFNALIDVAAAARAANAATSAEQALDAARTIPRPKQDNRWVDGLARIAALTHDAKDLSAAQELARTTGSPASRFYALQAVARATLPPAQDGAFDEALRQADSLAPDDRVNALGELVKDIPAASKLSAQVRALFEMRSTELAAERGDPNYAATAATTLAGVGDAVASVRVASQLDPAQRIPTLGKVAQILYERNLKDDSRNAALKILQAFKSDGSQTIADELVHVLPYLYPLPDARSAVTALDTPTAYIAWARAAEAAGQDGGEFVAKARELTLALGENRAERQDLLAQVGALFAQRGELYQSRLLAQQVTSEDARLRIYTAILRYDTVRARPQTRDLLQPSASAASR